MKKALALLMVAVVAWTMTDCSQNKQGRKADGPSAQHAKGGKGQAMEGQSRAAKPGDGKVNELTTADFKKKIMDYEKHPDEWVFEGDRPVIIDFYATWCRPCKMTAPVVEELANDYRGTIDFYKVDIDQEQELAAAFGIQSIPTFLFIPAKGTPTLQMGAMQKADFEKVIQSVILK